MNFSSKISISIFSASIMTCITCCTLSYLSFKQKIINDYKNKYETVGKIISETFIKMEKSADIINKNAATVLYQIEKNQGLPSDSELKNLAKKLGIKSFYTTDKNGKFIRSSDLPLKFQKKSLFSYCKDYTRLISGYSNIYYTPVIPSHPNGVPMKLTMIANHNRTLILESGIELGYINDVLKNISKSDKNIISLNLYSPNGEMLGHISNDPLREAVKSAETANISYSNTPHVLYYETKIPAMDPHCCECINLNVSDKNGKYFYVLRMLVSDLPILKEIRIIQSRMLMIILVFFGICIIFSRAISKNLVIKIKEINKTAYKIIKSKNLNFKVPVNGGKDEIHELSQNFNLMIKEIRENQNIIAESQKKFAILKIASRVAHDIRSPVAAINMALAALPQTPENMRALIKNSLGRINDIANNLLNNSKDPSADIAETSISKKPVIRSLTPIIEHMLTEKRWEYRDTKVTLLLNIPKTAYNCFVMISPGDLHRVLSNLINNAVEATDGKGIVTISLEHDKNHIFIRISDNGVGMSPEILAKAKENGFTHGKKNGSGIGLSSSVEYIEKINGQLSLTSSQEKGTTVTLRIPTIK